MRSLGLRLKRKRMNESMGKRSKAKEELDRLELSLWKEGMRRSEQRRTDYIA